MVLGETCKMAATWADRRKLAVLGAGRGDWLCIGTSLDALGVPGARHRPRPRLFRTCFSRPARALNWSWPPRPGALNEPELSSPTTPVARKGSQPLTSRHRPGTATIAPVAA